MSIFENSGGISAFEQKEIPSLGSKFVEENYSKVVDVVKNGFLEKQTNDVQISKLIQIGFSLKESQFLLKKIKKELGIIVDRTGLKSFLESEMKKRVEGLETVKYSDVEDIVDAGIERFKTTKEVVAKITKLILKNWGYRNVIPRATKTNVLWAGPDTSFFNFVLKNFRNMSYSQFEDFLKNPPEDSVFSKSPKGTINRMKRVYLLVQNTLVAD